MGGGGSLAPGTGFRLLQRQCQLFPHDPFTRAPPSLPPLPLSSLRDGLFSPGDQVVFLLSFGFRENYSFKLKFMPWKLSPNICIWPEFFSFFQDFDFYRPKPWGHLCFCFWLHDASGLKLWGWAQNVPDTWVKGGDGVGGAKEQGKLTQGDKSLDRRSSVKQFAKIVMFL